MKIDLMNKYHYTSLVDSNKQSRDKREGIKDVNLKNNMLMDNSGSFRGNGVTTTGFWKFMQKANSFCFDKETVTSNLIALFLTAGLRPLAIMSLPDDGKNKTDKIYATGHSISSGIIGFVFSSILMYPITEGYKKFQQNIKLLQDGDFSKINEKQQDNLKKLFNVGSIADLPKDKKFALISSFYKQIPDTLVFGLIKAFLTISMIPLILKYGFGIEKSKKPQEIQQNNQLAIHQNNMEVKK